jgi:PAS domain S-box-containing protein
MRRDRTSHLTNARAMTDELNVIAETDQFAAPAGPFGPRWWRNWFDHSPDAQFVLDVSGIVECNSQALRVLGHIDKSRILNLEPASLSPPIQPDGTPSGRGATTLYSRPERTVKFDWVHTSFDGAELPVEVVISPIDFEDRRLWLVTWHDIGERLEKLAQLEAEKAEAVQANQIKSEFLADVSHEIRTPMNGVLGMVDLLLNTTLTDRQRDCALTIQDSGVALLNIINDILDLSKMEAGKLELDHDSFDPYALIESVPQILGPRAQEKNLKLSTSVRRAQRPMVKGDAGRLRQILVNLVSNAVKFTTDGSVEIRAEFDNIGDDRVAMLFEVQDSGIGISEEAQRRLFDRFSQAEANTSRQFGGTGLGLSICKQLCDLMGAEIGVRSTEGEGSTFWIKAEFETASEVEAEAKIVVAPAPTPERVVSVDTKPEVTDTHRGSGLKILLAEDNKINQKVALAMLTSGGHSVEVAENGREAVDAVAGGNYDVVLMDIHMPEMDGVAATKAIRQLDDAERAAIPIIALTANAMAGSRDTYLAAGMDEDVWKPIDASLLNNALAGVGSDVVERPEPAKSDAPSAPVATPDPAPAETDAQQQDDLAELMGSLDQLIDLPDDN